ncbi:hypothetical protein [Rhizobium sp. Leaf383]|uniref:hypothetical protein n=1 Tax=Rhizobium sp. Leaf383 TaxID=1736357 RepID=UPI000715453F|nr:hypothetical protein [Rhizobium sp. Leaf383]KQS84345.1 hypothetical protein ASG58_21480 [Rhizobium sp. Leaf383]
MLLKLKKDLTPIRDAALARIDREAEATRGIFMTLGSGQAMVYDQKRDEAENFMRDQDINHGEIPHLVAEAAMNQITLFDQAVIYLTMRQQWLTVSPMIEDRRLAAKAAVSLAMTPAEIEAAATVDWKLF